ncbi:hypothetical protein lerEdw1_001216, partial [Lerista edwardsae]
ASSPTDSSVPDASRRTRDAPPTEILHCNGWEYDCVYYDVAIEKDGEVHKHVERGCGTKFACMNEPRVFGVPGLFLEMWKAAECTPAPKIFTKIGM